MYINNILCFILSASFTLIGERSWKKRVFLLKNGLTTYDVTYDVTYDGISRSHSKWPSLNSPQNVHEG